MKVVVQRVKNAKVVSVETKEEVKIGKGYLVLLGIKEGDNEEVAIKMAKKLIKLRLMADENEKMNFDLKTAGGELMIVSQFTLISEIKGNNRPSFVKAALPKRAKKLYELFIEECRKGEIEVKTGFFGKYMSVELVNDGPVTLVFDETEF